MEGDLILRLIALHGVERIVPVSADPLVDGQQQQVQPVAAAGGWGGEQGGSAW